MPRILPAILCAALAATPVLAQQQGAAPDSPQTAQPAQPDAPAQGAQAQMFGGAAPELVVSLAFSAEQPQADDVIAAATELADSDLAALIDAAPEGAISGTLVFEDIAAFTDWRESRMAEFFAPIGGPDGVAMEVTVFRPEELRRSDPDSFLGGLEGLSIHYANTGNHAAGDADIDAVTVICTGGDARCTPSN